MNNLDASNLASGTVPDARLGANVARTTAGTVAFGGTVSAGKFAGTANRAVALNSSGVGRIPRNKDTVRIVNALCKSTSKVLVTAQSNPGGGAISHVKPGKGFFDVFLTANAKAATKLGYLILA